jgi:hypothetical protein
VGGLNHPGLAAGSKERTMSVKDWKFHDLNMDFDRPVKVHGEYIRYRVVYTMTHLPKGSYCLICGNGSEKNRWLRKTRNEGRNGSVRYVTYPTFNDALDASIKWARRKDEERADEERRGMRAAS